MPHIIDTLIEERAVRLMQNAAVWKVVKTTLYPVLGYDKGVELADRIADMSGLEALRHFSNMLNLQVVTQGLEHVPATGLAMVMPNHPSGIADGVAVFDALKHVREDISFFANRDAIRVSPGMAEVVVPVEWIDERRNHQRRKETVKNMMKAIRTERLIVIFPSGRLAQPTVTGLKERPWQSTALNLALRYACPVVPMHIKGRNSWLYYLFYMIHQELRDITLVREFVNKENQSYQITVGESFIANEVAARESMNTETLTDRLRHFVTRKLPQGYTRFDG